MQILPTIIAASGVCAAGGIFAWAAAAPSAQLFGRTIYETGDTSTMALTFDDGPNPGVTPRLLDLLDRHNVRASFFLIGRHVRAFPALAKEVALRGHAIGNHTFSHPRLLFSSPRQIQEELSKCDAAIEEATGRNSRWMRPPFGHRGPQLAHIMSAHGYAPMLMWSVWVRDWKPQPAYDVIRRLHRPKGGDIVLMHDGDHRALEGNREHVLGALEYWLPRWKDAGIRFVTVDELQNLA